MINKQSEELHFAFVYALIVYSRWDAVVEVFDLVNKFQNLTT